jgi:hypothetical protein
MKSHFWQKIPAWVRVVFILIGVPVLIAISRVLLEHQFSRATALFIMIIVLTICSLPLMLKRR